MTCPALIDDHFLTVFTHHPVGKQERFKIKIEQLNL